jgi:hypothetical protein
MNKGFPPILFIAHTSVVQAMAEELLDHTGNASTEDLADVQKARALLAELAVEVETMRTTTPKGSFSTCERVSFF